MAVIGFKSLKRVPAPKAESAVIATHQAIAPTVGLDALVTASAGVATNGPDRAYATAEGRFVAASPEQIKAIGDQYLKGVAGARAPAIDGEVSRVSTASLAVDLNTASPQQLGRLLTRGQHLLKQFYHFTSGAGLWSRGGGQVKALVPFNLGELIPHKVQRLSDLSDLVNAKSPADVLFQAKKDVPVGKTIEGVAQAVVTDARREIDEILIEARQSPNAMTPLAMKLAHAANMSRNAGTFVPFDVWTSEQTHQPIVAYLNRFKNEFASMRFHPDPPVQAKVI